MGETTINQHVSNGVTEKVDNMALQAIIGMVADRKLKNEQVLSFTLGACPHCSKQFISMRNYEAPEEDVDDLQCVFCDKPVDVKILVYQFDAGNTGKEISGTIQVICLEEEADDLTAKYQAQQNKG